MKKIIALTALAFSMFMLAACDSMDGPSPLDTRAGGTGNELNPGGLPSDAAMMADSGLQERSINSMDAFDPENINPEDIVVTIYFGFDQYAVASSERPNVKKAADFFASNPDFKIDLVGHTDWYGRVQHAAFRQAREGGCRLYVGSRHWCGARRDNSQRRSWRCNGRCKDISRGEARPPR